MEYIIFRSIIGNIKVEYINDVVYKINITNQKEQNIQNLKEVQKQINSYLNKEIKQLTFKYELTGTTFQKEVYKKLLEIPYGKVVTYKDIAISLNKPTAYRAVGNANNKNNLLILVPCHRVVGKTNKLGYSAGENIKQQLLECEGYNGNLK